MTKTKFRPFWSYDVLKTQAWLEALALEGLILKEIHFKRRLFVFNEQRPQTLNYFIDYYKDPIEDLEQRLENTNYQRLGDDDRYLVLVKPEEDASYDLTHDGILKRNDRLKNISGIILLYQLVTVLIPLVLIGTLVLFSDDFNITFEGEAFSSSLPLNGLQISWFTLGSLLSLAVPTWLLYTYFKLSSSNHHLRLKGQNIDIHSMKASLISDEAYETLKQEKKLIKKFKFSWQHAPDELEQWLKAIEEKGFNLIKVNRAGNRFHFVKGEPRQMMYHVDFGDARHVDYFTLNQESGWCLVFTTGIHRIAYQLWRKEYQSAEPSFYSDQESKVKHARKLVHYYGLITSLILMSFG